MYNLEPIGYCAKWYIIRSDRCRQQRRKCKLCNLHIRLAANVIYIIIIMIKYFEGRYTKNKTTKQYKGAKNVQYNVYHRILHYTYNIFI